MTMEQGDAWLECVANRMKQEFEKGNAPRPEKLTIREFIGKFGWSKRTPYLLNHVRNSMEKLEIRTIPDIEYHYLGAGISIELDPQSADVDLKTQPDPTYRIEMLEAANRKPMTVSPNSDLNAATTMMLLHDYSQLPVMQGNYTLNGIVSWESIGARLSLGKECNEVRECMVPAHEIPSTTPLLQAISTIVEHGYVLVRGDKNTITGIVTASDLSEQFVSMAGPFLFIGQIEGHLRQLIHRKFTIEELRNSSPSPEERKRINGSADLTLGNYQSLFGNRENWQKLNLQIDRAEFVHHICRVREIRNEVMHFDPDGLSEEDVKMLSDVSHFFESLVQMGAI